MGLKKNYLCHPKLPIDSVAQLVEQMTLNHRVAGSSPAGVTIIIVLFEKQLVEANIYS